KLQIPESYGAYRPIRLSAVASMAMSRNRSAMRTQHIAGVNTSADVTGFNSIIRTVPRRRVCDCRPKVSDLRQGTSDPGCLSHEFVQTYYELYAYCCDLMRFVRWRTNDRRDFTRSAKYLSSEGVAAGGVSGRHGATF